MRLFRSQRRPGTPSRSDAPGGSGEDDELYADAANVDWNMRVQAPKAAPLNPAILTLAQKLGKRTRGNGWYNAKLMAEQPQCNVRDNGA